MSDTKTETPAENQPPPQPAEETLTLEQLEERNAEMLEMLGHKPRKKKEDKPAAATPQTPASAETPAETPEPAEAEPKKKKKPYAEVVADKISESVKRTLETIKPPEAVPQPAPTAATETQDISTKDQRTRKVLTVMAESPQYKEAVADFDRFVVQERDYIAKWKKENPGETFNADAEDHADFYKENEPTWDDEDFTDAKIELATREKVAAIEQKNAREKIVEQALKKVEQTQSDVVANLISAVDDKLGAKTVEEVDAKDPLMGELLVNQSQKLQALAAEAELLMTPGLAYKADDNNATHRDLLRRMYEYENELMRLPEEGREWNGRQFALIEDYLKMPQAQQRAHWTLFLTPEHVKKLLVADFASEMRKKLARLRPQGKVTAGQSSPTASNATPSAAASTANGQAFPSHSEGSERVPIAPLGAKVSKTAYEELYPS